eukprot:PhM_4_TR5680/c0_g1_i1/m.73913
MEEDLAAVITERDRLRNQVRSLERDLRRKDKQLREYNEAATELHRNIEEQEEAITNQLLRQREALKTAARRAQEQQQQPPVNVAPMQRSSSSCGVTTPMTPRVTSGSFSSAPDTNTPVLGAQPASSPNVHQSSLSPPEGIGSGSGPGASGEARDWHALYLDSEKQCQMLQRAVERMRDEVFLHRTRAERMNESMFKLRRERNETVANAEVRAEMLVDRRLHCSSRLRSTSISSASSVSECESSTREATTPLKEDILSSAAIRAHTRSLLAAGVPLPSPMASSSSSSKAPPIGTPPLKPSTTSGCPQTPTIITGCGPPPNNNAPLFDHLRDAL